MSDEFEEVSQYRAGELSPQAARALEQQPGFAERLRQLELLDATARGLSVELPPATLEALLGKVRRPPARRAPLPNFAVGLLVLALGVAILATKSLWRARTPWTLITSGAVTVDGKPAAPTARLPRGSTVKTGEGGAAQLVGAGGWVGLAGGGELTDRPGLGTVLVHGNAAVAAEGLFIAAADLSVEVHGVVVMSLEPSDGVARVTDTLNQFPSGAQMKTQWMKLSTVAATAAALGGGLTLFVVEGHASVLRAEVPQAQVQAGQRWKSGEGAPASFRAPGTEGASPAAAAAEATLREQPDCGGVGNP